MSVCHKRHWRKPATLLWWWASWQWAVNGYRKITTSSVEFQQIWFRAKTETCCCSLLQHHKVLLPTRQDRMTQLARPYLLPSLAALGQSDKWRMPLCQLLNQPAARWKCPGIFSAELHYDNVRQTFLPRVQRYRNQDFNICFKNPHLAMYTKPGA